MRNILFLLSLLIYKLVCFSEIIIPLNNYLPLHRLYEIQTPDSLTVSSNHTFAINTTNMNLECTPECYLNCQVQFPDMIMEKYCIINVCKCEIINESTIVNHKRQNSLIFLGKTMNFKLKSNFSFLANIIWFILLIGLYEIFIFIVYFYLREQNKENINQRIDSENIHVKSAYLYQRLICDEQN